MEPNKTLWMGNLDQRVDENYLLNLFSYLSKSKKISKFQIKTIDIKLISIKIFSKNDYKKSSAFIEFETPEIAQHVLEDYNNKIIRGQFMQFKWAKLKQKSHISSSSVSGDSYINSNDNKLFTVKIILYYYLDICRKFRC